MLKGVLFDLDDTLIDWSGFDSDWAALERRHLQGVFDYICAEIHPMDDLDAYFADVRRRTQAAWAAAGTDMRAPHVGAIMLESAVSFGVPADALDLRRCLEAYQWGPVPGTVAFPEAAAMLKLLHDHNIKVGIVTNAPQPMWLRDVEMQAHGLADFFPDCRISAADIGYLKPHPSIFQAALRCIDAKPEETVFVGDDLQADIVGAQGAGMKAVWRQILRRPAPVGDSIVPDATIHSLEQLPDILDGWFPGWRSA